MSMHWLKRSASLLLGAWLAAAAMASAAEPASDGAEPVTQDDLYQAALKALDEGRTGEATTLLERLIKQDPQHAGAWMELAISQCDLGNAAEAERLFGEIETRFNPPPGIRDVIATHRAGGCLRHDDARPNSWLLSIGRGYDNNVNQGASNPSFTIGGIPGELAPEFRARPDHYSVLTASYLHPLSADGALAIVQFSDRRNDHEREQDTASLLLGLEQAWHLGRWRVRATGAFGNVTLDGKLYQRQEALQLRAAPPIPLPDKLDLGAIANFSHVSYPTRTSYDGNTAELGATLNYHGDADQGVLTLSKLHDNGTPERPGGNRRGWFASAQWYALLRPGLYGEASLSHQHWEGSHPYSPGLIDLVRRQNTSNARLALQWYVQPGVSLHLEGRLVRNRENISLFEYNSRALQLSLRWDNF